jgi:hypothetical protein
MSADNVFCFLYTRHPLFLQYDFRSVLVITSPVFADDKSNLRAMTKMRLKYVMIIIG